MPVADGLTGRLGISGGGVTGYVALQPMNGVQQMKTELAARDADFVGAPLFHVRRATLFATTLPNPEGPRIDAQVDPRGHRRVTLRLGSRSGDVTLPGGIGPGPTQPPVMHGVDRA